MKNKYSLACYTIVLIVLLRVGIGWHFFYEGVHKFDPASNFSAEGFLGIAKGPTAELYYQMLPDLDGIQRLELKDIKDENDNNRKSFVQYEDAWKEYFKQYLLEYFPFFKSEAEAEEFVNMGAIEFAARIREQLPPDLATDVGEMYTPQLTAWATQYVPDADVNSIADMDAAQLAAWISKGQQSVVEANSETPGKIAESAARLSAIANGVATRLAGWADIPSVSIVAMSAVQRADWAKQNLLAAVAEEVIQMDATQLADWAKENLPLRNTSKGDALSTAKMLIQAKTIFNRYLNAMRATAADLEPEVEAFRASRDRFLEIRRTIRNDTSFEQQRRWRQMMDFRTEASLLTRTLSGMGDSMQSELGRLVDPELAGLRGQIVTAPKRGLFPENPFDVQMEIPEIRIPVVDAHIKSRMHVLDWSVTFGLTAIGLCLMLGFCTRLACLGGAVFLVNVVLTTYPVPGVYPEIPSFVGNFMFVSKDMVELLALLVLAAIPAGRWGGLDFFLWHYGGKQIVGFFCFWSKKEGDA